MRMTVNLKAKIEKAGALGKGVAKNGQAIAFAMPHMICEDNQDFEIVHLDNITVIRHKLTGKSYKVCCSKSYRFDISPSFTKGVGRSKDKIYSYKYYINKVADGIAFCHVANKESVEIIFKDTKNIVHNDDGIVHLMGDYIE